MKKIGIGYENYKRIIDDNYYIDKTLLIHGGMIEKQIHEEITYDDIHKSEDLAVGSITS